METKSFEVYDDYVLFETNEKFYVSPNKNSSEILSFDRISGELSLEDNIGQIPSHLNAKSIFGIVGVIRLLAGPYLIVITERELIGKINGHNIYRLVKAETLSFTKTTFHLNEMQNAFNRHYVGMLQSVLSTPYFYFSYTYDITHSLQRLFNTTPEFLQISLIERSDPNFLWNGHVLRDFITQSELHKFCLPLLHGYVSIIPFTINNKKLSLSLVSRRSCYRAGCRYFTRGLDSRGHAANFVETEQILEYEDGKASYVQSRGSIPLYWTQLPNMKIKPKIVVLGGQNHQDALDFHFENQVYSYGKQIIINLIDQKGIEAQLEETYRSLVGNKGSEYLRYEAFDFHHECRKMRWDRLNILMERLAEDQKNMGYFQMTKGVAVSQQEGIFRTNCIDCLDRTNVVQNMLAKRNLNQVLLNIGVLKDESDSINNYPEFEFLYRNIWADNADIISVQYAGTGAQKTDFTRYGKRTYYGVLKDLKNFMLRFYKNNFADGFRQDSIDLFLGNYAVEPTEGVGKPSPLSEEKDWKFFTLPVILLIAIAMMFLTLLVPAEYTAETFLYVLFWSSMVLVTSSVILYYNSEFIDYPKLSDNWKKIKTE